VATPWRLPPGERLGWSCGGGLCLGRSGATSVDAPWVGASPAAGVSAIATEAV